MQPVQEAQPFHLISILPVALEAHRHLPDIIEAYVPRISLDVQISPIDVTHWQMLMTGRVDFETPEMPFDLTVSIVGIFESATLDHSVEEVARLTKKSTFLILYPYLREAILDLSVRIRVPPLLIPVTTGADFDLNEVPPTPPSEKPPNELRAPRTRRKRTPPSE